MKMNLPKYLNDMELQLIQNKIYEIRGQKVMLDFDLAEMYQVETRVLNQAVKRNIERFPEDFMFQSFYFTTENLNFAELQDNFQWQCQIAT